MSEARAESTKSKYSREEKSEKGRSQSINDCSRTEAGLKGSIRKRTVSVFETVGDSKWRGLSTEG